MTGLAATIHRPPAPPVATERILIAIREETRRRFEPLFDRALFPEAICLWPDVSPGPEWDELLEAFAPTVLVTGWETPRLPERFAADAGSPLRYLCHLMGTVRYVVPRPLLERGVVVSNWGRQVAPAVAEHAMLLLLAALRNVPSWGPALDDWPTGGYNTVQLGVRSLRGRRVGIHGFGAVAREIVPMLRAFGARVAAYSAGVPDSHFAEMGVRRCASLEELFSGSDAIIECEGLTPQNHNAVTEAVLRCLPPQAVFVNVGRGALVDEAALGRLAREGRLRIALDVFATEPLPADSPVRGAPGAVLSPHVAGPTEEGFPALFLSAMDNVRRFLDGGEVEGRVTLEAYDRAT